MKNFAYPLFIGILLLSSCSKQRSIQLELNSLSEFGFFPLHVGNEWEFIDGTKTITDTFLKIDDLDYFRFVSNNSFFRDTTFYRQEGNAIFERYSNNTESLRFILDAKVADEWIYYENHSNRFPATIGSLKDKKAKVETENYTFKRCLEFYYDNPQIRDEENSIFLAEGIGIIRRRGAWIDNPLPSVKHIEIGGVKVTFE